MHIFIITLLHRIIFRHTEILLLGSPGCHKGARKPPMLDQPYYTVADYESAVVTRQKERLNLARFWNYGFAM